MYTQILYTMIAMGAQNSANDEATKEKTEKGQETTQRPNRDDQVGQRMVDPPEMKVD